MHQTWGRALGMAALAAAMAVLFHPRPTRAEEESPATPGIRIGLVSSLFRDTPESLIQLMTRPLKSLMESQTGISGTLTPSGEAHHLGPQFHIDKFHITAFPGLAFSWLR